MVTHSIPLSVGWLKIRVWYLLESRRRGAVSVELRSGLPFFAEEAKKDPSVRGVLDYFSKICTFNNCKMMNGKYVSTCGPWAM